MPSPRRMAGSTSDRASPHTSRSTRTRCGRRLPTNAWGRCCSQRRKCATSSNSWYGTGSSPAIFVCAGVRKSRAKLQWRTSGAMRNAVMRAPCCPLATVSATAITGSSLTLRRLAVGTRVRRTSVLTRLDRLQLDRRNLPQLRHRHLHPPPVAISAISACRCRFRRGRVLWRGGVNCDCEINRHEYIYIYIV